MKPAESSSLRLYGVGRVADLVGDLIVYRGLNPADTRLPRFTHSAAAAGIPPGQAPRKQDPDYARLVAYLLEQARCLSQPAARLERLIFLGDTHLSDATAFQNLCQAGSWSGLCFIGAEDRQQPPAFILKDSRRLGGQTYQVYTANRWGLLAEFERQRQASQFAVDEATVVVIDLDKTTLGARGRNAAVIDQARLQAVQETVAELLGSAFDPQAFERAYQVLNQPEFHPFTGDNQDYLAYICLILGSGFESLEGLLDRVRAGELAGFEAFIAWVDARRDGLPGGLKALHGEIYAFVRAGDPTPFKAFRRNEYRLTAARLGCLPAEAPQDQILRQEIVLTQEVRQAALDWKSRGALIFALSDKPDEASLPSPEQAAQGMQPLHRIQTHVVGGDR